MKSNNWQHICSALLATATLFIAGSAVAQQDRGKDSVGQG